MNELVLFYREARYTDATLYSMGPPGEGFYTDVVSESVLISSQETLEFQLTVVTTWTKCSSSRATNNPSQTPDPLPQ